MRPNQEETKSDTLALILALTVAVIIAVVLATVLVEGYRQILDSGSIGRSISPRYNAIAIDVSQPQSESALPDKPPGS